MNKKQMSLIIGSLLGDGYLSKPDKQHKRVYLRLQHSGKQKKYLEWKKKRFEEEGFEVSKVYDASRGFPSYRVDVKLPIDFGVNLRHQLYPNNNKTVTRHFLNYLDEEGLAIWFMDDGNRELHWKKDDTISHWALGISTHSFTYEEHLIIQKYFKTVWNIDISINKDRQYFRLRFDKFNSPIFKKLIEKYIEASMLYKITIPQTK